MIPAVANPYKHRRFSGEIISHAVWLYFRFPGAVALVGVCTPDSRRP
jgi:transposase-like protein